MLIKDKPVKVGDRVAFSRRTDISSRFNREPIEAIVETVGRRYITVSGTRFDFEGRDRSNDPSVYELWNSLADYQEARDRSQMISTIRAQEWRDWDKLPTDSLRTILVLIQQRN